MLSDRDTFHIKRLNTKDLLTFRELITLFIETFEAQPQGDAGEDYLTGLLARPGFIVCVVTCNHKVVGGLTAYELPMYEDEYSELYIYDMAVERRYQRKGLGKQLILGLKQFARESNIREIFVEAHEEDAHAVDFYRSAGGKAERVVHFNFGTD